MGDTHSSHKPDQYNIPNEDLKFLLKNTKMDTDTIKERYREFMKDNPSGRMDQRTFLRSYDSIHFEEGRADEYCKHVFRVFDKDKNGFIEFREFLIALSLWSSGTPTQKLEWSFQLYDIDNNGKLDPMEVRRIIKTTCELLDEGPMLCTEAYDLADAIFSSLDVDHDGFITKGEFIRGCGQIPDVLKLLSPCLVNTENRSDDTSTESTK